jgi:hypothetical protein
MVAHSNGQRVHQALLESVPQSVTSPCIMGVKHLDGCGAEDLVLGCPNEESQVAGGYQVHVCNAHSPLQAN